MGSRATGSGTAGETASAPSAASTGAGEYVSGQDGGYLSALDLDLYPRIDMLQGQKLELAQMLALTPMPPVLEPLLLSLWYRRYAAGKMVA